MPLSSKDKKQFKANAHALSPIVTIASKGLTENVHTEINRALHDHELIKIKIHTDDNLAKKTLLAEICKMHQAEEIQLIGSVGVIYRKRPE